MARKGRINFRFLCCGWLSFVKSLNCSPLMLKSIISCKFQARTGQNPIVIKYHSLTFYCGIYMLHTLFPLIFSAFKPLKILSNYSLCYLRITPKAIIVLHIMCLFRKQDKDLVSPEGNLAVL